MSKQTSTYLKLILSMVVFGSMGLFVLAIHLPSNEIVLVRMGLGCLVILAVIAKHKEKFDWAAIRKNLLWMVSGGICLGLGCVFYFEGYRNTTVSIATLIFYSGPVLMMLLSPLLFKEKLTVYKLLGVFAALSGIVLINGTAPISGSNPGKGVICTLLAVVLCQSLLYCNKRITGIPYLQLTLIEMLAAFAALLPYVIITHEGPIVIPPVKEIICLLTLGIVHGGWGYYVFFSSVQLLRAQSVILISYVEPFSALVLSAIFLQERLTLLQIIGAVLLLCGAAYGEVGQDLRKKGLPLEHL